MTGDSCNFPSIAETSRKEKETTSIVSVRVRLIFEDRFVSSESHPLTSPGNVCLGDVAGVVALVVPLAWRRYLRQSPTYGRSL